MDTSESSSIPSLYSGECSDSNDTSAFLTMVISDSSSIPLSYTGDCIFIY